jgi:hypothetical protein
MALKKGEPTVVLNDAQRLRIYAGMELEFPSAETVAKFILKSSLLLLSLIKFFLTGLLLKLAPQLIISTSARLA